MSIADVLGTIDYTYEDDVVLRICESVEKQNGNDVAALDINMGCPKPFSIAGGMGAALLSEPEKARGVGTKVVERWELAFQLEDTLKFVKMLERCGISAIGIHGRRKSERQGDENRVDEIREVARTTSVPVIANGSSGSIKEYTDVLSFWEQSGASSVMLARKALTNPSIFRPESLATTEDEIRRFLKLACKYDENFTATKYVVQRILGSKQDSDPRGRETVLAACVSDICKAWTVSDVYEYYKSTRKRVQKREFDVDNETGVNFIDLTFPPKRLRDRNGASTPKCVLNAFCDENEIKRPIYECKFRKTDKRYEATIEVDGRKFSSRIGQPNKRMAEQVAALAALIGLDKRERLPGEWEE